MEDAVEMNGDNIFGFFDGLVFVCAEAQDDNVPLPPAQIAVL